MTKREKRDLMQTVQKQLVAKLRKRFPRTEYLSTEERPDGIVALHLYAPYRDSFPLLDLIGDQLEKWADKGLFILVLPHAKKTAVARRAA